jgi:tetratricopeptide (TPR) repeat protein
VTESDQEWKLKLYGGFELVAPNGISVRLPYRGAQALIAVLALNRVEGLSREELGRTLWPSSPLEKRQQNLRQALAAVKSTLGPCRIDATRTHCRLAESFCVVTDHEDPGLRGPGPFMPGFEGEWFDRTGHRSNAAPSARLLDSFLHLLLWLAEHDPGKMLCHMRDNHGLTFGLSCSDRRCLLARAPDDPKLAGWKKFFGAGLHGAYGEELSVLTRRHRQVVSVAEANHDLQLAVQASSQLSLCNSWQNRPAEAMSIVEWCVATATSCSDKSVWATATQMKGNILIHTGKIDEGLEHLQRAEQLYRDPIDSAIMHVLRAYYLASMGRRDEASNLLDASLRPNLVAGHSFLNITWDMASAIVGARDKQPAESLDAFERIVAAARAYGDSPILMLAEEELAKAFARMGETDAAASHMSEAREIRRAHSRPYTPWDKLRLAS